MYRDASGNDHIVVDPFEDIWYKFKETHHPPVKTYDLEIDDGYIYSGTGLEYHEQENPRYFKIVDPSTYPRSVVTYVDDIRIRKYADPEPTTEVSATEEDVTGPVEPVPELPTIILSSIGLLVLVGYVVLRIKNR